MSTAITILQDRGKNVQFSHEVGLSITEFRVWGWGVFKSKEKGLPLPLFHFRYILMS
jgi:hypothetical protein